MDDMIPEIHSSNILFEFEEGPRPPFDENIIDESNTPQGGEKAVLPGGPATDRPIQNLDGKWYNNFGTTEISENQAREEESRLQEVRKKLTEVSVTSQTNTAGKDTEEKDIPEAVPGIDVTRLKGIYDRCLAKYEGKYPNGLLDINVVLNADDKTEVRNLIKMASETHANLADADPNWKSFVDLRNEMRDKFGTLREDARIVEDSSVNTTINAKDSSGAPILRVPTSIYRLNMWEGKIGGLDQYFDEYDKGHSKGRSASPLGRDIKETYRFIKEAKAPSSQTQTK
jgi:hypothetical protein